MLSGKKIIVGVTGSIAAYKAVLLVRLLVKEGAAVKVVMTPCAKDFITTLTFSTLSKNPVFTDFKTESGTWNNHVDLGLWADAMVIAPASANTIAKMANGICDNLLLATYLSARCPVYLAPAMDLDMFKHFTTRRNLDLLISFGNTIIQPETGELASGLVGEGRMAEPETINAALINALSVGLPLAGWTVLLTAGPTYEAIDPVRFIGNHSSGKMGIALAEALANKGAQVVLVCGPVSIITSHPNIKRIDVTTAAEMYAVCLENFATCKVAILAAAVADFTPENPSIEKIKKKEAALQIQLKPTKDILMALGKQKKQDQILVGFALETENEIENAKIKLGKKHLDFIVLNSLQDKGAGFKTDTNKVTLIDKNNVVEPYPLKSKTEVAAIIIAKLMDIAK
jgi:phosphopantothenoylcysteine decarboxylase/phosphopantothenate--cysteine ligase